jgi:hypothetical protein
MTSPPRSISAVWLDGRSSFVYREKKSWSFRLAEKSAVTSSAHHAPDERPAGSALAALSVAALGVVYGDIGTSPLRAS